MAKSMSEVSQTSSRTTSKDFGSVTFSQALAAGLTHSGWLVGPTTDPSGQEAAHASHSVLPGKVKDLTTSATFGPLFGGSSPSTALQKSLGNRLRQSLGANGSPEFDLTWKSWVMRSGPRICALRASAARRNASGSTGMPAGWATPNCCDATRGTPETPDQQRARGANVGQSLIDQAAMIGWPTPAAIDGERGGTITPNMTGQSLTQKVATIEGWATPKARDYRSEQCTPEALEKIWAHPRGKDLSKQALMAPWPTPVARDHRNSMGDGSNPRDLPRMTWLTLGESPASSTAQTAKRDGYRLNPLFSLWLVGYPPAAWARCAGLEMPSSRN